MDNVPNKYLVFILDRSKEPSTWRGVALLLGVLGVGYNPDAIMQIGVMVGAAVSAIEIGRKG